MHKSVVWKLSVLLCILFAAGLLPTDMRAMDEADFDVSAVLDNPFISDFLDKNEDSFCPSHTYDPSSILSLLITQINILPVMEEDLYEKTYAINKRNIVEQPAFANYKEYPNSRTFGFDFFYNQTSRMYFTTHSDCISSYLAVFNKTLLDKIDDSLVIIRETFPSFALSPSEVLALFARATVQNRQAGIMLHSDKYFSNRRYHLHIRAPLMYQERNFFLTEQEQKNIKNTLGPSTEDETVGVDDTAMDFARRHLIGDRCGIGDTRITFDWMAHKHHLLLVELGLQFTIPTAFAFEKGVFGSYFANRKPASAFNVGQLWDFAENGQLERATKVATDTLEGAIDRLSAMLLETGLGYDHHFGLGASFSTRSRLSTYIARSWARDIKFRTRASLEYFFPATELRYFIEKKHPEWYTESFFPIDEIQTDERFAQERLDFLSEQFLEKLFPFKTKTTVHPGIIFQWTSAINYDAHRWALTYISDFWFRSQESLGTIRRINYDVPVDLDVERGTRHYALQSKLGFEALFFIDRPSYSCTLSLHGDGSYWVEGIGHDFTLAFNVEVHY